MSGGGDATVRLFVALPVPDHVRVVATAARAPAEALAPALTWTRPEGWHVTLAFLGAVAASRVPEVEAAVADGAAGTGPITCQLDAAGRFGHRVLWLGVADDPAGAIGALGEAVQVAVEGRGLPVERRAVRPHLTLARASRRGPRIDDRMVAAVAPVTVAWEADGVELVRSHTGGGPARYETIGRWPLRA